MSAPRSPGWYPAPNGGGEQWWNGVAWSESRRDGTTARQAATHVTPAAAPHAAPVTNITPMAAPHAAPVSNITPPAPYAGPQRPNPYAGYQQPPVARAGTAVAPLALAAMITGIASIFVPIAGPVAIILGVRALGVAQTTGPLDKQSRSFAMVGIAVGVAGTIFGLINLIVFIMAIASASSYSVS
jgi:hypothetical protein